MPDEGAIPTRVKFESRIARLLTQGCGDIRRLDQTFLTFSTHVASSACSNNQWIKRPFECPSPRLRLLLCSGEGGVEDFH